MSRRSRKQHLLIATVVSLLAACSASPSADRPQVQFQAPPEAGTSSASPAGPAQASGVLNFTAPKLGGGQVVGSEFAGQNVAVWFWAPW